MERNILWRPEPGICAQCGESFKEVRRFTTNNWHTVYCFACWSVDQNGCIVSSLDWADDEAIVFIIEESVIRGTSQESIWN